MSSLQDTGWIDFPAGRQRIVNTTFTCTGDPTSLAAAETAASRNGGGGSAAAESPPLGGALGLAAAALAAVLAVQFVAAGGDGGRGSVDSRALASLVEYRVAYSRGWILKRLLGEPSSRLVQGAGKMAAQPMAHRGCRRLRPFHCPSAVLGAGSVPPRARPAATAPTTTPPLPQGEGHYGRVYAAVPRGAPNDVSRLAALKVGRAACWRCRQGA